MSEESRHWLPTVELAWESGSAAWVGDLVGFRNVPVDWTMLGLEFPGSQRTDEVVLECPYPQHSVVPAAAYVASSVAGESFLMRSWGNHPSSWTSYSWG